LALSFSFYYKINSFGVQAKIAQSAGLGRSMGPRFFYVYMGNQRAKASSGWHFAGNGMTSRFSFPLFTFTLQVNACLLAYSGGFWRAFLGSPIDC
jgi:hypothetical protein